MFINERILQLRYKLQREYLTLKLSMPLKKGNLNKQKNFMKLSKVR